jgi:hypothetical protein
MAKQGRAGQGKEEKANLATAAPGRPKQDEKIKKLEKKKEKKKKRKQKHKSSRRFRIGFSFGINAGVGSGHMCHH